MTKLHVKLIDGQSLELSSDNPMFIDGELRIEGLTIARDRIKEITIKLLERIPIEEREIWPQMR
jgi:hypothetical protein